MNSTTMCFLFVILLNRTLCFFVFHQVHETNLTTEDVIPMSDVVITGVPSKSYKLSNKLLRDGVIAINFSSFQNFEDSVSEKASIFVPSVGKVTIAMLQRNLLRLYNYQTTDQETVINKHTN